MRPIDATAIQWSIGHAMHSRTMIIRPRSIVRVLYMAQLIIWHSH
jgi:hypothetical protein